MRDDTPVKYESIVPSLTGVGVREARRRGRVPAVSVWVSLSVNSYQQTGPLPRVATHAYSSAIMRTSRDGGPAGASVCLGQGCAPLVNGTRPHART